MGFFPLQETPVLLVPWMVYTIFYVTVNTILYIVVGMVYLVTVIFAVIGVAYFIGAFIYFCK
jgi:hypothetical protein